MIIDCHVHLNEYDNQSQSALAERVVRLEEAMKRTGVDYALILSSYKVTPNRPSTADIVAAVEGKPHLGVVAGFSLVEDRPRQLEETRVMLASGKVKGLKIYPGYEPVYPHDPRFIPAYKLAAEFDVPVMIHTGDTYAPQAKIKFAHPLHVDEIAVDFPTVKFIICHLGNPWFRDCMEVVYKNRNVYADLSGLVLGDFSTKFERFMRRQLDELLLFAGEPSWLLFGTDWPICSMASYIHFMRSLKMPAADKHRIMGENAAKLFKIELPHVTPVDTAPPRADDLPRTRARPRNRPPPLAPPANGSDGSRTK